MFKVLTLPDPMYGVAPAGNVVLNLDAFLYFESSLQGQNGATIITLAGGDEGVDERPEREQVAVCETPAAIAEWFPQGSTAMLRRWTGAPGSRFDGCDVNVVVSQIRAIYPGEKTLFIRFLDRSSLTVYLDPQADAFFKSFQ